MEALNEKPAPWLVFQHGNHERSQTFFNMATGSYRVRSIRQMHKKDVCLSSHGWLLLRDLSSRYCFFNPVSLIEIEVPHLTKQHRDWICVLTAPPTDPNCRLVLLNKTAPIYHFSEITRGSKFIKVKFNHFDKNADFYDAVSCKGKIYFYTDRGRFGEIIVGPGNRFTTPRFLDVGMPSYPQWYRHVDYLIESCGEVFLVLQLLHWTSNWVFSILVFKMDFSEMMWVSVKSIGDRLFFLSRICSQSCSALELGLEGDQIFFFLQDDISLYSFHMKERSISVDLTCPNVQPPWKSPFWVIQTSNEARVDMKKMGPSNVYIKADMEEVQLINTNEKATKKATGVEMAEEITIMRIFIDERPWSDLPIEVVKLIAKRLTPVAYARMRSICRSWRSITPSAWLPLTPCLIFHEEMDGLCKFFDPLSKRVYAANIPELHGATFHYSKGSWFLVSLDDRSAFFFNPFTKERINLPETEFLKGPSSTMTFSSMPISPDSLVFTIWNDTPFDNIFISACTPGAQSWQSYTRWRGVNPLFHVGSINPVFLNGLFYCLGLQGNLGVYNVSENTWNVLKKPKPLHLPKGCFFFD